MATDTIMIYRIGSLGDTLMALPAFNRIRELFPNNKIVLLSNKPVVSKAAAIELVLGNHYFFNEILNYPVNTRKFSVLFDLLLNIRKQKVSQLFYLTPCMTRRRLRRDLFFFRLAGIRNFAALPVLDVDFQLAKDESTGAYEWEAKRIARRLLEFGTFDFNEKKYWDLQLTSTEIHSGQAFINHLPKDALTICFSIGTKCESNHWGLHNWRNLIEALAISFPTSNLIGIGSLEESEDVSALLNNLDIRTLNLCGKTTARQSGVILHKMDLFIGHDSGPMHLAGAVGTPTVAIFSSRNFRGQWFPKLNDSSRIIYHDVDCAGCRLEVCIVEKKKCILSITVTEVLDAVNTVLINI